MRGSITSRTGQMRTESPGAAISRSAVATRGSRRTSASAAALSTVRWPPAQRVPGPKAMDRTGKLPTSRRMGILPGAALVRVEERRPRHRHRDGFEGLAHDAHAIGVVLLGPEARIAAHVLDARAAHHAVGARGHREAVDGRDHAHRDPRPLDLFRDRCAATIAGPSGGDEEDPVNARLPEILPDAAAELARHGHGRRDAGQGVHPLVHAADLPLALEVAEKGQGQDVVRVLVHDVVEVPRVIRLPALRGERLQVLHRVAVIAGGVGRHLLVGVALPHEATRGDHGDPRAPEVGDGRGGRDAVGRVERHLAHEGPAVELVEQHLERALVSRAAAIPDAALALGDIPLELGGSQRLAPRQAQREARQARHGRLHARGRLRGGYDEHVVAMPLHRWIVGVHRRHRGDAEPRRGATGGRARQAVATGAEGRPRHQHGGAEGLELPPDGDDGRLLLLRHVVVAADDRADDTRGIAEGGLEHAPRPDRLRTRRDADGGALFAADPGEELVQVVDDTQRLAHGRSSSRTRPVYSGSVTGFGPRPRRPARSGPAIAASLPEPRRTLPWLRWRSTSSRAGPGRSRPGFPWTGRASSPLHPPRPPPCPTRRRPFAWPSNARSGCHRSESSWAKGRGSPSAYRTAGCRTTIPRTRICASWACPS